MRQWSGQATEKLGQQTSVSEADGGVTEVRVEEEMMDMGSEANRGTATTQEEEEEGELSDSSVVSEITASQAGDGSLYSFDEISDYLDRTKGKTFNVLEMFSRRGEIIALCKTLYEDNQYG